MIKVRTWFTLLLISLGTIAATASCGSDEATGGGGGTGGGGLLGGGGKGGASSTGRGGAVGRAGSSTGGGTSTSTGVLGTTCAVDGDCGTGFVCITAGSGKFSGGGPSQGLCTAACATDDDCAAFEPGAGCINMGTVAAPTPYCLEGCAQGDPADLTSKCQGRIDFACRDLAPAPTDPTATAVPDPFCTPRCRIDAECGAGLYCSPRSGLCSKTKPTGDPAGTPCDGNATTNNCAGICVGFSATAAYCADGCSGFLPCGYGSGTTPGGLCAGAFSETFGALDEGFCEPSCTCSGECKFPDHICRGWMTSVAAEASLETALASPGLCFPPIMPPDGSVELTACEGGAGGATGNETGGAHAGGAAAAGAGGGGAPAAGAGGGGAPAAGGAGAPAAGAGTGGVAGL